MTESGPSTAHEIIQLNLDDEIQASDTGYGTAFVDMLSEFVRYAMDIDRWYLWGGSRWEEDTERAIRTFALTQAVIRRRREQAMAIEDETRRDRALASVLSFEGVNKRRAMLTVASADPRVHAEVEDFDRVPTDLAAPNGVIDLNTGKLRQHNPTHMNSRCTTVAYDPAATSPLLDEFLETFLPDADEQRFVFALLGYCLRGGNERRLLPILWGPSTSGKSQLFAALHKILGNYVCAIGSSVFRGNLDDKPRPDLVNAMFTRIAYATEASKSWALHGDQVKRLTGGDVLPYRDLFRGVVNKLPRFTPLVVTNEMPRIVGADTALKRRIISIEFNRSLTVEQEDPRKKRAFLTDAKTLEALLARMVAGARDMCAWSEIPSRFMLSTMQSRSDLDHTDEFIEWALEESYLVRLPEGTAAYHCIKASELHALYAYWLKKFGDDVDKKDQLSLKKLNVALREKGWQDAPSAGLRWVGIGMSQDMPWPVRLGL